MNTNGENPFPHVRMDYMSYGPCFEKQGDAGERRGNMLELGLYELGATTARLLQITDRLTAVEESDLTEDNVLWAMKELEYHGEYFLIAAYEIQDRLAGLLATLCQCEKRDLIGRLRAYKDFRMPKYIALNATMPRVSEQFRKIEHLICSFVRLRHLKTHEASLHFEFLVDKKPYDPEEFLRRVEEPLFGPLLQVMRREVERFIERHRVACEAIDSAVDALDEAVREAERLDEPPQNGGLPSSDEES